MGIGKWLSVAGVAVGTLAATKLFNSPKKRIESLDEEFKEEYKEYLNKRKALLKRINNGDKKAEKKLRALEENFEEYKQEYEEERSKLLVKIRKTDKEKDQEFEERKKELAHNHEMERLETIHRMEMEKLEYNDEQYERRMQTRSANIGAYQIEKQAEVGVAGAEALGKMGEKGAGNVHLGNGVGFNPAAMMTSMAVGGTVAQNISATMNNAMNGNSGLATPPPLPKTFYYVAINGQSDGPYELDRILQMVAEKSIARNTLIWKNGMVEWQKAGEYEELKAYFPPEIR